MTATTTTTTTTTTATAATVSAAAAHFETAQDRYDRAADAWLRADRAGDTHLAAFWWSEILDADRAKCAAQVTLIKAQRALKAGAC